MTEKGGGEQSKNWFCAGQVPWGKLISLWPWVSVAESLTKGLASPMQTLKYAPPHLLQTVQFQSRPSIYMFVLFALKCFHFPSL